MEPKEAVIHLRCENPDCNYKGNFFNSITLPEQDVDIFLCGYGHGPEVRTTDCCPHCHVLGIALDPEEPPKIIKSVYLEHNMGTESHPNGFIGFVCGVDQNGRLWIATPEDLGGVRDDTRLAYLCPETNQMLPWGTHIPYETQHVVACYADIPYSTEEELKNNEPHTDFHVLTAFTAG